MVVRSTGSTAPSGNVVFTVGSVTQTIALNSAGVASYWGTAPSTAGGLTLSAAYQGTAEFAASTSNTLNETIALPVTASFKLSGTAVTISPGAITANTSTITVTPAGGFTGSVVLAATITSKPTGAQYAPTVSFGSTSPVNITDPNAQTATLTISTTASASGGMAYGLPTEGIWATTFVMTLAFVSLFGRLPRQRCWRIRLGTLALVGLLAGGMSACGAGNPSGGSGGTTNLGTTAGVYTITVTGTSGMSIATSTITLTVE
jgi:hypothetical protein